MTRKHRGAHSIVRRCFTLLTHDDGGVTAFAHHVHADGTECVSDTLFDFECWDVCLDFLKRCDTNTPAAVVWYVRNIHMDTLMTADITTTH